MKKYLAAFGLLMGLAAVCHAGTPVETFYMGQPPLSNKTIVGSTSTLNGGNNCTGTVASVTSGIGQSGQTVSCRNCFTKIIMQLDPTATFYMLDGSTTDYFIFGTDLGTGQGNTLALNDDHLGPVCMTAGQTTSFKVVGGAARNSVNWEGYSECGGTANAGAMQ